MPVFDWWWLLLAVPVMMFAGWVHGALGLGFPMIATPLIAVFVDVKIAILLTLLPTAAVNVASVLSASEVRSAVIKYLPLVSGSLVGAVIGSVVLASADPAPFRLLLAALIVTFLLTSYFKLRLSLTETVLTMIGFGLVAGLAGGTTNVMVAVLIVYFLSVGVQRSEMVPAMNLCFLVGKLSQIVVFLVIGLINFKWLVYTVPLALVSLGALKLGQNMGSSIEAERYRNYLQVVLLLLALILVVQYFAGRW